MSPWTTDHIEWLIDTGDRLKTADGEDVEIWEFRHQNDQAILSSWAKHFRNHYCFDTEIDSLRGNKTRADYLNDLKFPQQATSLGPSIRAGDFAEILVADYLEWVLDYWVPRVRWGAKMVRDESPKGSDVIGFQFEEEGAVSEKDTLAIYEVKAKFSDGSNNHRLQDAVNDSAKDHLRIDESLNYIKQRLLERQEPDQATKVERFQSPVDYPYSQSFGAAAVFTSEYFADAQVTSANTKEVPVSPRSQDSKPHPNRDNLVLLVIKGADMMSLVHDLFQRAADEA